jgi:hypothetical protein
MGSSLSREPKGDGAASGVAKFIVSSKEKVMLRGCGDEPSLPKCQAMHQLAPDHQLLDERQSYQKRRASVILIFCGDPPVVRLDNGTRDGQPHSHAFRLAGEKRIEDLPQFFFSNTRAAIRHG